ncbi:MAG: AEC family transporter [Leptospiraceae bacterium]|nr:AEC family transporter [Leptospiraceae bacterium]MDW7975402.1 AEC family transporter [Leptospiraceae bacterium]
MSNIILIIVSFLLGILFRRWSESSYSKKSQITFPIETPKVLNAFIIYISLPSLILYHIHEVPFQFSLIALIFMPWIVFAFGILTMNTFAKLFRWDKPTTGGLILTSGLGNTSFVGLPMIEAFYGKEFLGYGLIADQGGTFFMLSTLGLWIAMKYTPIHTEHQTQDFISITKRILFFPPFFVLMITLILRPFPYPDWLKNVLLQLGSTLPPLALFSVGFQLKLSEIKNDGIYLIFGLLYKLLIAPILIVILYAPLDISKEVYHIAIFEAAMGPMITGGIVAISYQLRPSLVALMLALGIPLSFFTAPIFWYFFH